MVKSKKLSSEFHLIEFIYEKIFLFPKRLKSKLDCLKYKSAYSCFLTNLPFEENICRTPINSRRPKSNSFFTNEIISCCFALVLGIPYGFQQQNEGEIFQNASPTKKNESQQSGESSKDELLFHNDGIFNPSPPDYVIINCLRQDKLKEANTCVLSLYDIFKNFDPEHIKHLKRNRYIIRGVDIGYSSNHGDKNSIKTPIISEDLNKLILDFDLMEGVNTFSSNILNSTQIQANKFCKCYKLSPGDILITNNLSSVHKKTPFQANYDGQDRWIQLTYVNSDISNHSNFKKSKYVLDVEI